MIKKTILAAIVAIVMVGGASSAMASPLWGAFGHPDAAKNHVEPLPGDAEKHVNLAGGDGFLTAYNGMPGRREHVRRITAQDLDDVSYAADECAHQLKDQQPDLVESESVTIAEGTLSEAGSFAAEGVAVSVPGAVIKTLAREGAGAGIVGSAVNAFDSHNRAKRIHHAECVENYLNDAIREGDVQGGIHYIPNVDSVVGTKIKTTNTDPGNFKTHGVDDATSDPANNH